jgi:small subunit ribosomal protein S21
MQALRSAAARAASLQRLLPTLPRWAQPALGGLSTGAPCSAAAATAAAPPAADAAARAAHARRLWGRAGSLLPPAAAAAMARLPGAAPCGAPGGVSRGISVIVEHNNMDKALRRLKRKMIEEGITKELKERTHNQKPSQLRVRTCVHRSQP